MILKGNNKGQKRSKELTSSVHNGTSQTLHYVEESSGFVSVAKFLSLKLGVSAVGASDYFENDHYIIVSFHERGEERLINTLVVFNTAGELQHKEALDSDLKGMVAHTFFIVDEALIFVKNRSQLMGLLIEN